MTDAFKRSEITHIDEMARTATCTLQWFLENASRKASHPITHNNRLKVLMCGEETFADIARQIVMAKESIDICLWGFDPGMELAGRRSGLWPRGDTFGDLLVAAGKRGVKVRLLVWYDALAIGPANQNNMPGYTHDTSPWRANGTWSKKEAALLSAKHSLESAQRHYAAPMTAGRIAAAPLESLMQTIDPAGSAEIASLARKEYCNSWYRSAFEGLLKGIEIRTRSGDSDAAASSLGSERHRLDPMSVERNGLVRGATHHQKCALFDFFHEEGANAVAYVMGLNSVTNYWDTNEHRLEDERREQGGEKARGESVQGKEADRGFRTMMPYHDYACRIEGRALVDIYNNFIKAWERAARRDQRPAKSELGSYGMPTALLRRAEKGDSSVQIVRTQPDEKDKTIQDIFYQAVDVATLAAGYLYIENQYFQHAELAERLMDKRKMVIARWRAASQAAGKTMRDMPIMYVFIVIPVPEREGMIPRTYDALATLGQQEHMTGQNDEINEGNAPGEKNFLGAWREVLQSANKIDKPDPIRLESEFGLKICTAMLNTCAYEDGRWRYREIYIHSKLMLVDDVFMMLGSANLNLRSMSVDSEINIATNNPDVARQLRARIWAQHSGGTVNGENGSGAEIKKAFRDWEKQTKANKRKKIERSESSDRKKMIGFLLPLEDCRSSYIRMG